MKEHNCFVSPLNERCQQREETVKNTKNDSDVTLAKIFEIRLCLVATSCCSHIKSFGECTLTARLSKIYPFRREVVFTRFIIWRLKEWLKPFSHCHQSPQQIDSSGQPANQRWVCVLREENKKEHRAERWPASDKVLLLPQSCTWGSHVHTHLSKSQPPWLSCSLPIENLHLISGWIFGGLNWSYLSEKKKTPLSHLLWQYPTRKHDSWSKTSSFTPPALLWCWSVHSLMKTAVLRRTYGAGAFVAFFA